LQKHKKLSLTNNVTPHRFVPRDEEAVKQNLDFGIGVLLTDF